MFGKSVLTVVVVMALMGMARPAGASPGDTTLMSVSSGGMPAAGQSTGTSIGDGYLYPDDSGSFSARDALTVGFFSTAANLVPGDTNPDAFIHDVLPVAATSRVSLSSTSGQGNSSSLARC